MSFFSLKYPLLILTVSFCLFILDNEAFTQSKQLQAAETRLSKQLFATLVQVDHEATPYATAQQLSTLHAFVQELQSRRAKYRSEVRFLSYFFRKVHRKFLKRYRHHTTLHELLAQGHYDCVTGTALYALLLDALGISYQIHEFPYHVYLTATTMAGDTVMIESTDPQGGFVTRSDEQAARQAYYSQPDDTNDDEAQYQYDFSIQGEINLTELAGLSYFNEAVAYYNRRRFQRAGQLLQQANRLYASPRMEAFESLMAGLAQR